MINVTMYEDKQGYLYKYTVEGHSNYAEHGKDIVCSAVSALTQTILLALEDNAIYRVEDGYMDVVVDDARSREAVQALFKALRIGIKSISEAYPDNVRLITKK